MLRVYTLALFVSATLLFLIQPMFARLVLPLLGGSPAVWNTALVFFQVVLLAGYAYAHASTRWLGVRRQAILHCVLLFVPLVVLPIAVPGGWLPPSGVNPVPWLLALFGVAVGLPFFVVSTLGPTLQKWFSESGDPAAKDPYFLYAASNVGSLLGLLIYPLALEPLLRLGDQSLLWTAGYGLLIVCVLACAGLLWRRHGAAIADAELTAAPAFATPVHTAPPLPARAPTATTATRPPRPARGGRRGRDAGGSGGSNPAQAAVSRDPAAVTWARRLRWIALAFVPSSLLLGVTLYMSVYVAPIPLFWVIPLALYLVTFILAFGQPDRRRHQQFSRLLPWLVLVLVVCLIFQVSSPILLILLLHLAVFVVGALVCHGELAFDRPTPEHLTEFYLWLSVGGALGGVFNALIAPVIFPSELEYPIALVALCLLLPTGERRRAGRWLDRSDLLYPAVLAVAGVGAVLAAGASGAINNAAAPILLVVVPLGVVAYFAVGRRPLRFGLGVGVLLVIGNLIAGSLVPTLYQERTFFGAHRVIRDPSGQFTSLVHGSVVHGTQAVDVRQRDRPTTYYAPSGPFGDAFAPFKGQAGKAIGVVGLGAGSLACYHEAGQRWTFFEIDSAVVRIATNPALFTYLKDCAPDATIKVGDGRLLVQAEPPASFDMLVLDAYTSDALPVHMLTREALTLFLDRLAPGGLLLFNISNKYADLGPVLGSGAEAVGAGCLIQSESTLTREDLQAGKYPSTWAVLARDRTGLTPLGNNTRWRPCPTNGQAAAWSDDRLSVFGTLQLLR